MFLGVDGGGTKTAFALVSSEGDVLARHQTTSAYYLEVGFDGVAEMIRRGVLDTLALAGLSQDDVRYAFFGLPSYGEDSALQAQFEEIPRSVFPHQRYRCGNDMVCSWAGSLACFDGISVVAGTGSIAYGQYAGRSARCGGWGELFSDEGSAYWIAREGLNLFSRMSDGRIGKGLLHAIVRERLNLSSDLDLCAAVYAQTDRSRFAQFSKLVRDAAEAGDLQAQDIFFRAAQELAAIVNALRSNLGVAKDTLLPVSYSGGVFSNGSLVLAPFQSALTQRSAGLVLTPPRFPPVIGAALFAAKLCSQHLDAAALQMLDMQTKVD